jgi:hypothetical protein
MFTLYLPDSGLRISIQWGERQREDGYTLLAELSERTASIRCFGRLGCVAGDGLSARRFSDSAERSMRLYDRPLFPLQCLRA